MRNYNPRSEYLHKLEIRARRSPFLALLNDNKKQDDMFYVVERKGRAVKSAKTLLAAQLACASIAESGIPEIELRITDNYGHEHPKAGG